MTVDLNASLETPVSMSGAPASDPYYGAYYGSLLETLAAAMLSARTYTVSWDVITFE